MREWMLALLLVVLVVILIVASSCAAPTYVLQDTVPSSGVYDSTGCVTIDISRNFVRCFDADMSVACYYLGSRGFSCVSVK